MECSRALVGAGLAAFLVGQVRHEAAFVPTVQGQSPASAAGLSRGAARAPTGASVPQGGAASAVAAAAVGATVGAVGSLRRSAARGVQRVARKAEEEQAMQAKGPVMVYTQALMDVAATKKESEKVTKDVLKVKNVFSDEDFLGKLQLVQNELGTSEVKKASGMIELFGDMESAVFPKFVTFLAKKKRLTALKSICAQYVSTLYTKQSVAPVMVRSAQRLTSKQLEDIKSKMKAKTGASDVKLVAEVDAGLLGGFVIEWGFTDPENLTCPTEGMDLSLKSILASAALNEGVVVRL